MKIVIGQLIKFFIFLLILGFVSCQYVNSFLGIPETEDIPVSATNTRTSPPKTLLDSSGTSVFQIGTVDDETEIPETSACSNVLIASDSCLASWLDCGKLFTGTINSETESDDGNTITYAFENGASFVEVDVGSLQSQDDYDTESGASNDITFQELSDPDFFKENTDVDYHFLYTAIDINGEECYQIQVNVTDKTYVILDEENSITIQLESNGCMDVLCSSEASEVYNSLALENFIPQI